MNGTVTEYGLNNYHDLHVAKNYTEEPDPPASLSFLLTANQLMMQRALHFPDTIADAMSLYAELITLITIIS